MKFTLEFMAREGLLWKGDYLFGRRFGIENDDGSHDFSNVSIVKADGISELKKTVGSVWIMTASLMSALMEITKRRLSFTILGHAIFGLERT